MRKRVGLEKVKPDDTKTVKENRKWPSFPLSNLSVWSSLALSLEREKQSDSQSDTQTMSPQAGRAKTITLIP